MSLRIRHCVECPRCQVCYLVGFSPYRNGAYIVRSRESSDEEYTLYCFCGEAEFATCSRWRKVQECEVTKEAYARGYGSRREVWPIAGQAPLGDSELQG
jgi:hypothetical protein